MAKPITTYVTPNRLSWYGHRRHTYCKGSNDDEGGREETSRKAQTEVDGQRAERFETTPARPIARSAKVSMSEHDLPWFFRIDWDRSLLSLCCLVVLTDWDIAFIYHSANVSIDSTPV